MNQGTVYITRRAHFNAAHRLFRPEWSDEKNLNIFGKCSNPYWHGHNYELFVTVKGTPDPETGFVMDLKVLGDLIEKRIINKLDHKNLNIEVDFLNQIIPTTENLVVAIWNQLDQVIMKHGCQLHCIKLFETENNFAEYFGG